MESERVVPSAPSAAHLYIEGDSTEPVYHQMCYMRPPASELCGRVPMLLEPPEVSARSCGLRPAVLPPEVVLVGMPESSDDEAAPDGGADAPADRERCEAAVAAAERAARRGARLPPHVRAMRAEEWALAFEGASVPFGALTADQLLALADEAGSAALADLLLDRALGRLLCAARRGGGGGRGRGGAVARLGAGRRRAAAAAARTAPRAPAAPGQRAPPRAGRLRRDDRRAPPRARAARPAGRLSGPAGFQCCCEKHGMR